MKHEFVCSFCNKMLSSGQSLTNHIFSAHFQKKFECETCGVKFRDLKKLENHKEK